MAYPGLFHRIVVIGTLYTEESFNFTLSVVSPEDPSQVEAVTPQLLEDLAADVADWWPKAFGNGGVSMTDKAKLTELKVNRIDASGHYEDNEAMTHLYPTPIAGGAATSEPAQLACAVSLRTAVERGRGSRGRFYLPAPAALATVGADGRLTTAQAGGLATGAKALIDAINQTYWARDGGLRVAMRVGVASNIGAGVFQPATYVEVGRVPDTIRSRRSSLVEDHQSATLAP